MSPGSLAICWVFLLLAACGSPLTPALPQFKGECRECDTPQLMKLCEDGMDNDEDQLIDCEDPDCSDLTRCSAPIGVPEDRASLCDDGVDNDQNGHIDCEDWACVPTSACQTPQQEPEDTDAACYDGLDNDRDGSIDCFDSDCGAPGVTVCEASDATCSDGLDNDENGYTDCGDFSCSKSPNVTVCP